MAELDTELIRRTVRSILTSPEVDLAAVTVKEIRSLLAGRIPGLDVEAHKAALKPEIRTVFDELHEEEGESDTGADEEHGNGDGGDDGEETATSTVTSHKRKRSTTPEPGGSSTTKSNGSKKPKTAKADADVARKLHEQMNGSSVRTTRASTTGKGSSRKKGTTKATPRKRKVKSEEVIDDSDDEEGGSSSRKSKKSKKPRAVSNTGFNKLMRLSPQMADVCGESELSRPQIVKRLWAHIKANDLQDPNARTEIVCDEKLKSVFGLDRVNSFKMNKYISNHVSPLDES